MRWPESHLIHSTWGLPTHYRKRPPPKNWSTQLISFTFGVVHHGSSWWSWFKSASPPKKIRKSILNPHHPKTQPGLVQSSPSRREALVVNQTWWIFSDVLRMSPRKSGDFLPETPAKVPINICHLHIATSSSVVQPQPSKCMLRIRI